MKKLLLILLIISSDGWAKMTCEDAGHPQPEIGFIRCQNEEAVCYVLGGYTSPNGISCFRRTPWR